MIEYLTAEELRSRKIANPEEIQMNWKCKDIADKILGVIPDAQLMFYARDSEEGLVIIDAFFGVRRNGITFVVSHWDNRFHIDFKKNHLKNTSDASRAKAEEGLKEPNLMGKLNQKKFDH